MNKTTHMCEVSPYMGWIRVLGRMKR